MEEAIKQIGQRLRGLREVLDITTDEAAQVCGISSTKRWRTARASSL